MQVLKDGIGRIYSLSDPETGEIRYIGKTTYKLCHRYGGHLRCKDSNHRGYWINSILKKGLKPVIEELDSCILEDVGEKFLNNLEIYWISQFKAWGFRLVNSSTGGEGASGVKYSEEHRMKMRISGARKKVYQYLPSGELIKEWISTEDAGRGVGVCGCRIAQCCRSKNTFCKGFIWTYEPEDVSLRPKKRVKKPKIKKGKFVPTEEQRKARYLKSAKKKVYQFTLDGLFIKEWPSTAEADRFYGVKGQQIAQCCRSNCKTCKGYFWRYSPKLGDVKYHILRIIKVEQFDRDGHLIGTYNSVKEAMKASGLSFNGIVANAKGFIKLGKKTKFNWKIEYWK